jgi:hypothetical protein
VFRPDYSLKRATGRDPADLVATLLRNPERAVFLSRLAPSKRREGVYHEMQALTSRAHLAYWLRSGDSRFSARTNLRAMSGVLKSPVRIS